MSDMFTHYGIDQANKNLLIAKEITEVHLVKALNIFDPIGKGCELTKLSLMYYIDVRGDFQEDNLTNPGLIANAMFESLDVKDKIQIFEYLEWHEEN